MFVGMSTDLSGFDNLTTSIFIDTSTSTRVQEHCVCLPYLTDPELASMWEAALSRRKIGNLEKDFTMTSLLALT